jgi:hypothetical protein
VVGVAVGLCIVSVGVAAMVFSTGSHHATSAADAGQSIAATATSTSSSAPAVVTVASATSADVNPSATPAPSAVASSPPITSARPDARTPTTGTVRAPKAYGRRIYVDGHIIGEGGRDLVAPCGTHRVRVGSAGTDRTLVIPCGATLELD